MDSILPFDSLLSALSLGAWTLLALGLGLTFYGYVADRVIFEAGGRLRTEKLGLVDAFVALVLGALVVSAVISFARSPATAPDQALPGAAAMIASVVENTVFLAIIIGGIFGGLSARHLRWRDVFGFDRLGPGAVVGCGLLSLLLALPLIGCSSLLSRLLLAAGGSQDDSSQELVRFLGSSPSQAARVVVAVSAVVIAPISEEIIFRGYLYGVVRRYAGVTAGILVNATLFAAIHTHLPSFGGLFVLAVCLTLAYEWTGSIFVPITMHALFNALSVAQLLQGGGNG